MIALVAGALLILFGTLTLIALLIAGFWEGFAHRGFTLGFLALTIYVVATAGLSFLYAVRKPNGLGWALAVLYVPAVLSLVWMQRDAARSKGDQAMARDFVDAAERVGVVSVAEPLTRIVETEDDFHAIDRLIQTLQRSEDLGVRLRIVELFAEWSPPNGHAHMALRNLYAEMAEKGGPEGLRAAVRDAILTISPDDRMLVQQLDDWRQGRSP